MVLACCRLHYDEVAVSTVSGVAVVLRFTRQPLASDNGYLLWLILTRRKKDDEVIDQARKKVVKAWGKILPFGAQVVASIAAYNVGVTATQVGTVKLAGGRGLLCACTLPRGIWTV